MHGPEIIARSMSVPCVQDQHGRLWQYHSRSDQHSKVACWALLFDLLRTCPLLLQHVRDKKIGFGINHEMRDFRNNRSKYLDLVICTPGSGRDASNASFAELAQTYGVKLTTEERELLIALPDLHRTSVGSVHVAIEAKAAMTEHVKALPRLFDELNSSHLAIHGSAEFAIAVGFAMVNSAETFISPGRNPPELGDANRKETIHKQPKASERTIQKIFEIPRRTHSGVDGFDAIGILVIDLKNDGSPVTIVKAAPAPSTSDVYHYDQMIRRIASLYANKFGNV